MVIVQAPPPILQPTGRQSSKDRLVVVCCIALFSSSCGGSSQPTNAAKPSTGQPHAQATAPVRSWEDTWPSRMITNHDDRPGLFLGSAADAPVVGYMEAGVLLEPAGPVAGERLAVRTVGPLQVEGFAPLNRLSAYVQKSGLLRDAPVAVEAGDLLELLGPAEDGWTPVRAHIRLPGRDDVVASFVGSFPTQGLGGPLSSGTATPRKPITHLRAQGPASVHVKPQLDAAIVMALPAAQGPLPLHVVTRDGEWSAVQVGAGPYIVGYVQGPLVQAPSSELPPASDSADASRNAKHRDAQLGDELPKRLQDHTGELHRVRAGTELFFDGLSFAKLAAPGYARELMRHPAGEIDAFIAIDDGVAVRGLVRSEDLTPYVRARVEVTLDAGLQEPGSSKRDSSDAAVPTR